MTDFVLRVGSPTLLTSAWIEFDAERCFKVTLGLGMVGKRNQDRLRINAKTPSAIWLECECHNATF